MNKTFISFPYGEYEGEGTYDQPHGKGVFRYFDDGVYKGEWKNGKYHGKGKLMFTENIYDNYKKWEKSEFRKRQLKIYKKYWKEMHGYGLALKAENFHINSGRLYELRGVWDKNRIHYGKKTDGDWSKYTGEFKNNLEHGNGKIIWNYNEKKNYSKFHYGGYTGEFKNGKWHGKGVWIDVDYLSSISYFGESFEKKRIKGDRIVAEWIGKWKNGHKYGRHLVNVYYFNPKQKLKFKKVIDVKYIKKGEYWRRR